MYRFNFLNRGLLKTFLLSFLLSLLYNGCIGVAQSEEERIEYYREGNNAKEAKEDVAETRLEMNNSRKKLKRLKKELKAQSAKCAKIVNKNDDDNPFSYPTLTKADKCRLEEERIIREIERTKKDIEIYKKYIIETERALKKLQRQRGFGGGCFPKSVKVLMKDGTYKNINEVKVNDMVTVYDIGKDELSFAKVIKTLSYDNNHLYIINNGEIKATEFERFLTPNGYKRIKNIKEGDEIFDGNAYVKVSSNVREDMELKVYNLTIENAHNFFVSNMDGKTFLVHNTRGGGRSSRGGSDK